MTPILVALVLVALVLAALVAAAAGAVVLWTALGRSPLERRIPTPADWVPGRLALPGCALCRLSAEAGESYFAIHVVTEHPERYGSMRPRDRERFETVAAARRAA